MGWFSDIFGGGGDRDIPQFQVPEAPQYKTAQEFFDAAIAYAQGYYPGAFGAREGALSDLAKGTEYYESFMPTSLEEAFANAQFQDVQARINQGMSLAGIEYSPALAGAYGKASTGISSALANLGQRRAEMSLLQRLGIDPQAILAPHLQTNIGQSNKQAEADFQRALLQAQSQYAQILAKRKEKQAGIGSLSTLGGMGLGALLALPTGGLSIPMGMALGGAAGGTAAPLFGGSTFGLGGGDLGDIFSMINASGYGGGGYGGGYGGGGYATPQNFSIPPSTLPSGGITNPNPIGLTGTGYGYGSVLPLTGAM